MLVIGNRGASGLSRENTMAALAAGKRSGCDILHIDVRLTRDGTPVLLHDATLMRTHGISASVSQLHDGELFDITHAHPVPTLEKVLDAYFGKIILLIELRSRGSAIAVTKLLKKHCQSNHELWDTVILASHKASDLFTIRKMADAAPLALLHDNNPFAYIAYHRALQLTAVGFHRLHTNRLAHQIARRAELFTFCYTVNRPQAARIFESSEYDGIITSYPDRISATLSS